MGKKNRQNKKRKLAEAQNHESSNNINNHNHNTTNNGGGTDWKHPPPTPNNSEKKSAAKKHQPHSTTNKDLNPLLTQQAKFLSSLQSKERTHYFSDNHVSPDRRAALWMEQAERGERLVNDYAWATPNDTALKIFQHFSPIIELGCGRNAYWASWMQQAGDVDVVAYDSNVQNGGKIATTTENGKKSSNKKHSLVQQGGPNVLRLPQHEKRTLFLCYPDEEDDDYDSEDSSDDGPPPPFGWQCLDNYQGTYLIHAGELAFWDVNLSMDQAPWGRSSSMEFQQRLAAEFHCVLKVQLPNWLHVRDSISVWKRSQVCPIVFAADEEDGDDDEEDEVVEYRHIPPDELLPQNVAAPCLAHLLPAVSAAAAAKTTSKRTETELSKDQQQLLVHFQTKTHVVSVPSTVKNPDSIDDSETSQAILQHLAESTGWAASQLRITHWNHPFVHVTTQSSIRGGKGGFGTLLKGQSRQAGAKLTMDFGACRDLQGRRLRHVNDEIKLRKFRERQRREQAGEKVDQDELWKTPSGIYNWHLMTPTWADISKKAAYRIKRQFRQMEREDQKKAALKKEQEELHQKTMSHYLTETTALSESVQKDLGDAIKQGLKKAAASKNAKKRKLAETVIVEDIEEPVFSQEDRPSSLVSLTGEVVMEDASGKSSSVQLQSKSDFMTAALVLDGSKAVFATSSCYYEITLVTGGLAQIGWASLSGDNGTFEPNNETGDGVGDDGNSFAVDGSRGLKFHDGQEWPFSIEWKAGDRLGCLLENDASDETKLSFSLNGKDLGVAFTTKLKHLVPAFSCNEGEILELHTSRDACQHFPSDKASVVAVKELLQEDDNEKKQDKKKTESTEEVTKEQEQEGKRHPKSTSVPLLASSGPKEPIKPEPLNLDQVKSSKELEALGLDRLKSALMAMQVKCG